MANERRRFADRLRRLRPSLSGTGLKIFGCFTMLFYTLSMTVFQNGLIGTGGYTLEQLQSAMASDPGFMRLTGVATGFQLIGGLSVPVFAFLLAEGFEHTASFGKYLLSMLAFGALSEVPYDWAIYGKFFSFDGQNVMFTYAICLIMLYGLRMVRKKYVHPGLFCAFIVLAAVLWASLLRTQFGLVTVLLCAIYYLLRERRGLSIVLGCLVSVLYITAPLSGYALWGYNGDRGKLRHKYIFYVLYPLHLLALGWAAKFIAA